MSVVWTKEQKDLLYRLWSSKSAGEIAKIIGKTRNSIIGAAYRMGIPPKPPKPKKEIPAAKDKTPYVNPVLVVKRPIVESPPIAEPWSGNSVPMLEASYGQCRAIIGSTDALNETVMVCGSPIKDGSHYSFCDYHHNRYTQPPRR